MPSYNKFLENKVLVGKPLILDNYTWAFHQIRLDNNENSHFYVADRSSIQNLNLSFILNQNSKRLIVFCDDFIGYPSTFKLIKEHFKAKDIVLVDYDLKEEYKDVIVIKQNQPTLLWLAGMDVKGSLDEIEHFSKFKIVEVTLNEYLKTKNTDDAFKGFDVFRTLIIHENDLVKIPPGARINLTILVDETKDNIEIDSSGYPVSSKCIFVKDVLKLTPEYLMKKFGIFK